MENTNSAADLLKQVRYQQFKVEAKLREIDQLESMINRVTMVLKPEIVQSSPTTDRVDSISRLIELREQANALIDRFCDAKDKVARALDRIDDPLLAEILIERYVEGKSWEAIAESVQLDRKTVTRRHGLALHEFEREFQKRGKIPLNSPKDV